MRRVVIPQPARERLSLYLRFLEDSGARGLLRTSSRQLGAALQLTDAQVRKDLAMLGQFGQAGVGYEVQALIQHLRQVLDSERTKGVILVGAGNLGRALLAHRGFARKGFVWTAVVDADPDKIGKRLGGLIIEALDTLDAIHTRTGAEFAVIAVPASAAQEVANRLTTAGIKALMNFAPVTLHVPPGVNIQAVDLAVELEQLAFRARLSALARHPPLRKRTPKTVG
ncbi:MAG: redox-sensing transcriptional repressor Rex [Phycisphaerae bacterium]